MKVMEHFISLVLMEAGGWGLEEGGIARRGEGSWYQGPIHLLVITAFRGAAKPISTFIYLTIS